MARHEPKARRVLLLEVEWQAALLDDPLHAHWCHISTQSLEKARGSYTKLLTNIPPMLALSMITSGEKHSGMSSRMKWFSVSAQSCIMMPLQRDWTTHFSTCCISAMHWQHAPLRLTCQRPVGKNSAVHGRPGQVHGHIDGELAVRIDDTVIAVGLRIHLIEATETDSYDREQRWNPAKQKSRNNRPSVCRSEWYTLYPNANSSPAPAANAVNMCHFHSANGQL